MLFTWWRRYADFNGRSSRKEYWLGVLGMLILCAAARIVDLILFREFVWKEETGPVGVLLVLALVVPALALLVRRLHDTGRSGWWALINLIPIAGGIVLFIFTVIRGEPHANRFGPAPPETPDLAASPDETPPPAEAPAA